ncbi:MAG: NAD-dependent epimerase/dehydratase family protein [Acidobacteria bacterium]|nr:NAD-dependent epimerase/dehydratase family protein [Acidobacteriota bacterium]
MRRVLVTGISGNLGRRLAPLLQGSEVVSVDLHPPAASVPAGEFVQLDLSDSVGQEQLGRLLQTKGIEAVLHLAFVIDPVRTGIVDEQHMWRANVAATQQLLESIAQINSGGTRVRLFVFPSSVSAYGPDLPDHVREDAPLQAHALPYAVHKREADEICQQMHPRLGGCAVYIYRPHIYAGYTVDNFILRAFRGKASGRGWLARTFEKHGWKLPTLVPSSARGENLFQFVHVDDVARVLLWTLGHFRPGALGIFNLAGRGPAISFADCVRLARTPILRLPSEALVRALLRFFWLIGLSGVPPQALPYFLGSYTMDTTRLQDELGPEFEEVVRYSSREAFSDALRP